MTKLKVTMVNHSLNLEFQLGKVFSFFGAGIEPRASRMLGKQCTTGLHPSPSVRESKKF
jgi:hypothetical protein